MIGLLDDILWAVRMVRARRWRGRLSFSKRVKFDAIIRHPLGHGAVVAYPDAFYHTDNADVGRAMRETAPALYDAKGNLAV